MMERRNGPPRAALRILHFFLRQDLADEVTGDLIEQHKYIRSRSGSLRADLNAWYQALNYLRPFALRRPHVRNLNSTTMYKSYMKTTMRGMARNKLHAFINIAGLTVGLSVVITIGLWIRDEMSYEKGFDNHATVGRVIQNVTNNGNVDTWWSIPFPLAGELRQNYGNDFKHVVLGTEQYQQLLKTDSVKLMKEGLFAEPAFAEVFSLRMIRGTRESLQDPSSILLSASAARAYFAESDPIGQAMTLGKETNVHVAGVFDDLPEQSVFYGLEFICSWSLLEARENFFQYMTDPWRPNSFALYVQLKEGVTFESASINIRDAKLRKVSPELAKKKPQLFIHPMDKWHLYSDFRDGKLQGGRIQYVWLFGIVGVFVMLMACINFMNLSTARSEKRAKEVGIRKAVGSFRSQLIAQFFSESIFTTFISLALALFIVQMTLSWFNEISGKHILLPWSSPLLWVSGLTFCILIGLIAGSYPAIYLSSIKSGQALKGAYKASGVGTLPRKVLVVVQFTVSVMLIIGTLVVFLQIKYAKERAIGYQTNGLIAVPGANEIHSHFDAIKTGLVNDGAILEMGESDAPTTRSWASSSRFDWRGKDPDLSVDFPTLGISHDYGRTIGWQISQGRDFSREFMSDSAAMIINEAAAQYMGFVSPVGEIVTWGGQPMQVVGVVKDIISRSPYEPVPPSIYYLNYSSAGNYIIVRLNPDAPAQRSIAAIEAAFKPHLGDQPFSYEFADEQYARKFDSEGRIGTLATIFSSLAILISCLGTFGLSSFVAEQRTKEIGVRKVMGASRIQLWQLMSRELAVLVVLSCVIAVPLAYTVLSSWLAGYAYRTSIPVWTLIAATAGTLVITLGTASWHTLQAASVNPVKSLRTE